MCLIRAILTAAGAAVITGAYFYLYRSSAQKQETTEEIPVPPVEEERQTVEERQAEAELTVDPDVSEKESDGHRKSVMEEGEIYSPQEEGQAPAIIEELPEAPGLLQDSVLAEKVEAEVIVEPDLCEKEIYIPQKEGQAPQILEDQQPLTSVDLAQDLSSSSSDDGHTKKRSRRRGTRGRGRKINYKKDIGEERSQRERQHSNGETQRD